MKNTFIKSVYIVLSFSLLFANSCKKDDHHTHDDQNDNGKGELTLKFEHNWGERSLQLHSTTPFVSQNGDSITFTQFNYYISNIELVKSNGEVWKQPESYHLIKLGASPLVEFTIKDVPNGEYSAVRYLIGVDSVRNVSGAQEGALDPKEGMFWSWNTGYIFIKIEGTSPQSTDNSNLTYHVGGFNRAIGNSALVQREDAFEGETLHIKAGHSHSSLHYKIDASKLFDTIEVGSLNRVKMPGANAMLLAQYFSSAIKVDHVH